MTWSVAGEQAAIADELGLDLVGIQDHPYQWRYLETWALIADLFARTERVRFFPDVANLPLRGPAMIAKQAASLDVLSGGRFELGLGAGAFWDPIAAMGGPRRSGGEALQALEEAMHIIRAFWSGERSISFAGEHYSVKGLHPGPPPTHPIGIWLGVGKPKALALTGRLADGWVPSLSWATPDLVPDMQRRDRRGSHGRRARAVRDPPRPQCKRASSGTAPQASSSRARRTTGSRRSAGSQPTSASTRSSSGRPRARWSSWCASRGRSCPR